MKTKGIITERPSKYVLLYGIPLKDIARRFNVSLATIHNWKNDPKKREWMEKKLKENNLREDR
ncbi:hypothetical protein ES707_22953 [subsurface metagenome]